MSASEQLAPSDRLADLPRLPRDEGGPVFAEPWQAQAFALAVKLSEQGHFTWKEWAASLAEELQADGVAAFAAGYDAVLAGLEQKKQSILTGTHSRIAS